MAQDSPIKAEKPDTIGDVGCGPDFKATLRVYQQRGVAWLTAGLLPENEEQSLAIIKAVEELCRLRGAECLEKPLMGYDPA